MRAVWVAAAVLFVVAPAAAAPAPVPTCDAGRLSRDVYARVIRGELAGDYFPSIRRRKWAGPAVTGFRQAVSSPAYRQVLGEVRKLWAAQAAGRPVAFAGTLPAW
jgi:hypothetical protein